MEDGMQYKLFPSVNTWLLKPLVGYQRKKRKPERLALRPITLLSQSLSLVQTADDIASCVMYVVNPV